MVFLQYVPGNTLLMAGPTCAVALGECPRDLGLSVWECVAQGPADVGEVLAAITRNKTLPLARVPHFAVVHFGGGGDLSFDDLPDSDADSGTGAMDATGPQDATGMPQTVSVAVRGDLELTMAVAGEGVHASGAGKKTWLQGSVDGVDAVHFRGPSGGNGADDASANASLDGAGAGDASANASLDGDGAGAAWPLEAGMVWASAFDLDLVGAGSLADGEIDKGAEESNGHQEGQDDEDLRPTAAIPAVDAQAGKETRGYLRLSSGERIAIERDLVIGRQPHATSYGAYSPQLVPLPRAQFDISRNHLLVQVRPEGLFARDMQSTNGSLLRRRGQAATRLPSDADTQLLEGDIIDLGGDVTMRFEDLR